MNYQELAKHRDGVEDFGNDNVEDLSNGELPPVVGAGQVGDHILANATKTSTSFLDGVRTLIILNIAITTPSPRPHAHVSNLKRDCRCNTQIQSRTLGHVADAVRIVVAGHDEGARVRLQDHDTVVMDATRRSLDASLNGWSH